MTKIGTDLEASLDHVLADLRDAIQPALERLYAGGASAEDGQFFFARRLHDAYEAGMAKARADQPTSEPMVDVAMASAAILVLGHYLYVQKTKYGDDPKLIVPSGGFH